MRSDSISDRKSERQADVATSSGRWQPTTTKLRKETPRRIPAALTGKLVWYMLSTKESIQLSLRRLGPRGTSWIKHQHWTIGC